MSKKRNVYFGVDIDGRPQQPPVPEPYQKPRLFTRRWFLVHQIDEDFFWAGLFLAVLWGIMIFGVCYAQWSMNQ